MIPPDNSFTDDRLLGGRVHIRQPASGYRVAVDPVLLAAAVPAKSGQQILDAGCGTGAALFCLAARVAGLNFTGLERQALLAEYAQAGVALNGLASSARIIAGDLAQLVLQNVSRLRGSVKQIVNVSHVMRPRLSQ